MKSDIDLHDGIFLGFATDDVFRSIEINIRYWPSEGATSRVDGVIKFNNVKSVSLSSETLIINENLESGNIGYWVQFPEQNITIIYLSAGYIRVCAEQVDFV